MSTSGGAGYCDCGDMEAWKSEPFCNVHKRGATKNDKDPKVSPISIVRLLREFPYFLFKNFLVKCNSINQVFMMSKCCKLFRMSPWNVLWL